MLPQETVNRITEIVNSAFPDAKIILFGSHARNAAAPRSDVDLLIVSSVIADRYAFTRKIRRLLLPLDYGFDIVALTEEEYESLKSLPGTVARYASQEGRLLQYGTG